MRSEGIGVTLDLEDRYVCKHKIIVCQQICQQKDGGPVAKGVNGKYAPKSLSSPNARETWHALMASLPGASDAKSHYGPSVERYCVLLDKYFAELARLEVIEQAIEDGSFFEDKKFSKKTAKEQEVMKACVKRDYKNLQALCASLERLEVHLGLTPLARAKLIQKIAESQTAARLAQAKMDGEPVTVEKTPTLELD